MGLRQRVSLGFFSIVAILILAGMISFFELSLLSSDTDNILESARKNSELSQSMLSAVRRHSDAFVRMTAFSDREAESTARRALERVDSILLATSSRDAASDEIDSIRTTVAKIREISESFFAAPAHSVRYESLREQFPEIDSLGKVFAKQTFLQYQPLHEKLTSQIDQFGVQSQLALAPNAKRLHNNAYRAVTPVLISLIVMIAFVLMLYYFILIYCVKPIVTINRSLKDFIAFKIPFAPKSQNIDEIKELCERVDTLIKEGNNTKL